jgi:AAA domain
MLDKPHPNAPKREDKPKRKALKLVPWNQIRLSTAPQYLIKKLFPKIGLAVVYGPPKCGKTFWLFDVLMHIALGWEYRGRRTQQGGIVYCLFEGQDGFAARKEAFQQRFLSEYSDDVPFVLMPIKIELVKDHAALIALIKAKTRHGPVAVAIDTLNRSFTGSESSDEAMTAYVAACDAIREALNCLVVIVHHSGLAEGRSRGHTSLLGAADAQIGVKRDAVGNVVACVEYMKDGPDGESFTSRLDPLDVGIDDDGEAITSCTITEVEGGPVFAKTIKRSRRDKTFDEAFDEIILSCPQDHHVHRDGPLVQAVDLGRVEMEFKRRYVCDKGDAKQQTETRKKQWQAAVNDALSKRGYAAEVTRDSRQLVWKTERE